MDSLRILTAPWIIAFTGLVAGGIALAVTMDLFGKNQMPVDGRTILLTGASEGLGRSAALQLAAKGANLILVARNVGNLQAAVADVQAAAKSSTQRFHYISADVAETNYAARVIADATAWNGGKAPDIVWCVAGMSTPLLWAEDDNALAAARRNMDVNYFGAAEMSRAILREWLSPENATGPTSEPKHLIFTASVLALFAVMGYAPYNASKWALRGLADTLAMEMGLYPNNPVKIHIVYPATITSPGLERENSTKPGITKQLEEEEPPETPETVATRAIAGLEKGNYMVTVSFLGEAMRCGAMGGSPRNSWIFDTLLGWLIPFVYMYVLWDMNGKIRRWAQKYGHPRTYKQ